MTVDLTIISLLEAKHEIDSSSLELFLLQAEIPGADLEQVKAVLWERISGKVLVHELIHSLHFPLATNLFHVAVLSEIALIKEFMLDGIVLERLWYSVITITDYGDDDVLLTHAQVFIHVHGIVVLDNTFHGSHELRFILVIHSDTNSKFGLSVLHNTQVFHTSDEGSFLDDSRLTISSEATGSDNVVIISGCEAHGLERTQLGWFPVLRLLIAFTGEEPVLLSILLSAIATLRISKVI